MKSLALGCVVALALAGPGFTQSVDVSTITCNDLVSMDQDGITTLLFWIDGYMGGAADDASFDLDRLGANIDGALGLCENNPDMAVMDALMRVEND